jgi:hypothetical protein
MTGALRAARRIAVAAILAIGLGPFAGGPAKACSCMWGGPFLTVAPHAQIIVRVRIRDYHEHGRGPAPLAMDVAVLEQLKGPEVARDIRIWGDNGALCRPYVSQFPRGTEWILAIHPPRHERPGAADYVIPGCGAYWLQVHGDRVKGQIRTPRTPVEEDSLDAIRAALNPR